MYVKVSIPISSFTTFTYSINKFKKSDLFLGQSVVVPFRKKLVSGFIVELVTKTNYTGKILPINSLNQNCFYISKELWKTIIWVSKYYVCSIGNVLQTALSYQHKTNYKYLQKKNVAITKNGQIAIEKNQIKFIKQKEVLGYIYKNNNRDITELKKISTSYMKICQRLQALKYLKILSQKRSQNIFNNNPANYKKFNPNKKQTEIYKSILGSWNKNINKPALISGLPGSGKTLIYIQLIKSYITLKKQVIVLVPEISLIPQTYNILKQFFHQGVGTWHSRMTTTNKNLILSELKNNKISIIISTRSGIFFPFNNLGLIIVDEEQESSYKQDGKSPYYHARDVALIRSQFNKSKIALISSTPSIESYYKYLKNDFLYYYLDERFYKNKLPKIKIINMNNKENYGKNFGLISRELHSKIQSTLGYKQQIIILHNRLGKGIQKIEHILKKLFPQNTIYRYDSDSIKKSDYFTIINNFQKHKIDILLGTQILAKGINFNNVGLVGVINADLGKTIPDFRIEEKNFQLLYQFIGRVSQNIQNNLAIIQTFNPDNMLIKNIYNYDIEKCYTTIINNRKDLFYPPFSRLIRIIISGKNLNGVKEKSNKLAVLLKKNKKIKVLGPSPAPVEIINNHWRYNILIKSEKKYWLKFFNWFNNNLEMKKKTHSNIIKTKLDVDPNLFL